MAFAILRTGKIHHSDKRAAQEHNHRLGDISKIEGINPAHTPLNIYPNRGKFLDKLAGVIPAKHRKDATLAVQLLLTASPEFFDSISNDRVALSKNPKFKEWVNACHAWAKATFGDNLIDVSLHLDERTPHFHIMVVPVWEGRLCGKLFTSRVRLIEWQDSFAGAMAKFGLQRGIPHRPGEPTKRRTTLKQFYRAVKIAADFKGNFPPPPVQEGILDHLDYLKRLEQYAARAKTAIDALMVGQVVRRELIGRPVVKKAVVAPAPAAPVVLSIPN